MKKMWSEEEVNAAIAEYAATHPAGGKLFLHNVSFFDDTETVGWAFRILSTEKNPFTSLRDIIGKVISVSGSHSTEDGTVVLAIAKDSSNFPAIWYVDNMNNINRSSDPQEFDFADEVTNL